MEYGFGSNQNDDLRVDFTTSFEYPEEEIHASIVTSTVLEGLNGMSGMKVLYNTTQLLAMNLYQILINPFCLWNPLASSSGFYKLGGIVETLNSSINVTLSAGGHTKDVAFKSTNEDNFGSRLTKYLLSSTQVVQNLLNGILQLYFGQNPSNELLSTQDDVQFEHQIDPHNPKTQGKEARLQWHIIIPAGIILFNMLFLITYRRRTIDTTLSENPSIQPGPR